MDRNGLVFRHLRYDVSSLSARRAWIEISIRKSTPAKPFVALRKESVDRNRQKLAEAINPSVALRKESVDRNDNYNLHCTEEVSSLSARRAWIEILAYPDMIICTNGRSPQGERG